MPFFADGSIIGDYKPLFIYWRILREKGRNDLLDKAFLKREDFELVNRLVEERGRISLRELIDELTERFMDRVDPDIAMKAFTEVYGVSIDREYARRRIAYILAGWLIEASKNTGILKISK